MEPLARIDLDRMTVEDFERESPSWAGRWELLNGMPVRMQAESRLHSRTSRRIFDVLARCLAGHRCTPDERVDVRCGTEDIRNPDILIDCHPDAADPAGSRAFEPIVVFEVAVTSQATDLGGKHLVYFNNPHIGHYVAVLPRERRVVHFARNRDPVILGPGDAIDLFPRPGLRLEVGALLGPE